MRVKWVPFCDLRGPFFKKGGTKSKKTECFLRLLTFYMGRTRPTLCRHFGTSEKAWARITAESRMFLNVQSTFIIERPSNQCCCQWCFSNTLFQENSTYPWVYFFLRPIRRGNVNFMRHFFLNCGNPARPLWDKPWKTCTFLCLVGYYILGL